jgi:hypothetical protein
MFAKTSYFSSREAIFKRFDGRKLADIVSKMVLIEAKSYHPNDFGILINEAITIWFDAMGFLRIRGVRVHHASYPDETSPNLCLFFSTPRELQHDLDDGSLKAWVERNNIDPKVGFQFETYDQAY